MTTRRAFDRAARGFFAIGVYHAKTPANVGTLWRSAMSFGAAFVFTIGHRYQRQASDTTKTPLHMPLFHFPTFADLLEHTPHGSPVIGVEMADRARALASFCHPLSAVYLLGAEDHGLPPAIIDACHGVVQIEAERLFSLNVAVAGSILMYHRHIQRQYVAARQAA